MSVLGDIPINIEYEMRVPMDFVDDDNTGFPFERDFDRNRDGSFRTQLDDIAKRHPEFAEHLQGFPLRSGSRTQQRRPSAAEDPEFLRHFDRPFGSRFERSGFPFDDEFDSAPQTSEYYEQHPTQQQSQPQSTAPEQSSSQEKPQQNTTETESQERGRSKNIQPSNTVDLGQKQEPVNERNQRSMSAPPTENRQNQQRFVSSINIPMNRDQGSGDGSDMGKQYSTQPPQSQSGERVIPIHVEGRDDPVLPKNVHATFRESQPERIFRPEPQPERIFAHRPEPHAERIFGHRPEQFTQFVREPRQFADAWHHPAFEGRHGFPQEEFVRKHNVPQQNEHYQQQKVPPQQQKQNVPSQQQKQSVPPQPQQQQTAPPPQPQEAAAQPAPQPPKPSTPIDQIQAIQKDVSELMEKVDKFTGAGKTKEYLYLDEMLTRNLLKLDNIDTQGQDNIRTARREAIKCIEKCISLLEAKAMANMASKEENMEVGPASNEEKPLNGEEKKGEMMEAVPIEGANEEKAPEPMEVRAQSEEPSEAPKTEAVVTETENKSEEKPAEVNEVKVEEKVEEAAEPKKEESVEQKKAESKSEEQSTEASVVDDKKDEKKEKKKSKKKSEKKQ